MHSNYQPGFTIIIPTYNRKKYLLDTLHFALAQKLPPLEIIVVDVSEKSLQLNEQEQLPFKSLLKYVSWNEYGNISKQRNHAINMAKGEYILFLDDDVIFDADLLQHYSEAFATTRVDAISGLIETEKYRFGSSPLKFKGILSDVGEYNLQPCDVVAPTKVICTASFAIKTDVLKAIGGFDEDQRGSYDDMEIGFRLSKRGYKILHHSLPKVFHLQAKASGARDSSHGNKWAIENQVYFLLKHRYNNKKNWFLFLMLLEILKPSRAWLQPSNLFAKTKIHVAAFNRFNTLQKTGLL